MESGAAAAAAAMPLIPATPHGENPGDRPAANPRSTRSVVMGRNGMIATSQPLASAAGLRVLEEGGNAIDAAVAAAAVLAVVEPSMTGIGGDLFALLHDAKTKTLRALNASGRSPYAATPDVFAISAVNTGIFAVFASTIALPIAVESYGVSTIASTFFEMKSSTWLCCTPLSRFASTTVSL